ncbi:MAG: dTMP kinase [Minwuia sp.]|uniref:dTMP kinase n=1 Tax=Minwuia sp. TaxID=2493630 RepID=UPI003A8406FD
MTAASKGLFITFEGGEGTGKSTQAARLAQYLARAGHEAVLTREPGGTAAAEALRTLLLDPANDLDPLEQVLVLLAARANHVRTLIRPALARGAIVICDRFSDSTMAYQGLAGGLGRERIDELHRQTLAGFRPDLTLLLDLPVEAALERRSARGGPDDRFEARNMSFHRDLRQAFLEIAAGEPGRVTVIDAAPEPEAVWETVRKTVERRLEEVSG